MLIPPRNGAGFVPLARLSCAGRLFAILAWFATLSAAICLAA